MTMEFNLAFDPARGTAVPVAENVWRMTANNPSPFTFHGTNSYIIGADSVAVVDPGPAGDEAHLDALLAAIGSRAVSHILVTHTHMDHSPLAAELRRETGAKTVGYGPYRASRALRIDEKNMLDASNDIAFVPDIILADDEVLAGEGWAVRGIFTPGHASNHLAFALEGTGILFAGDHVMGWSTTIVAPPDGSMADYMASLETLLQRDDRIYLPGHGGPVDDPQKFVRGLRAHRKMRERAILARIAGGDRRIPEIVAAIYRETDPRLHGAAGLSVFAHIEDLAARGLVRFEGLPALDGVLLPA